MHESVEKIRIGIVGLNFGEWIINDLLKGSGKDYFEVAAVCDINEERTRYIAETYNVKAYFKLDDLLADTGIPAIGLFTSPGGRSLLIDKIITSGKDVITTKPFELDACNALKVLTKAREMGRVIHLNSPSPLLNPGLKQIKEWSVKYNLGRIVACRCDTWASYREQPDGKWYDDPEQCPAAPVFRIGIYLINDLVRLFGKAEKVQVIHSSLFTRRPTPDNAQLSILFKNGAICNVFASFCINDGQPYKNSLTVNFERGTVYRNIEPLKRDEIYGFSRMSLAALDNENNPVIEHIDCKGASDEYQWDVFYKAVRGERLDGEVTPEEIAEGIKIINAMARAQKSGCMEIV